MCMRVTLRVGEKEKVALSLSPLLACRGRLVGLLQPFITDSLPFLLSDHLTIYSEFSHSDNADNEQQWKDKHRRVTESLVG